MVQMTAADRAVVKALPGNTKCCDCNQKNPEWASVSFGTVFCLECSGVHRSLGVHITFVRSIAMDSWTDPQLALMKAGGNDKCNKYLADHGIPANTPIKQKYESPQAQLYKEVLKARVQGKPEPTSLPTPPPRRSNSNASSGGNSNSFSSSSKSKVEDPNGMERLTGESDQQYIQRQTRLKAEAKARMAAKFGNSGGMGGMSSRPMGGVGSDSSYNPNTGYSGGGAGVDDLVAGFGSALSTLGTWGSSSITKASAVLNDPNLANTVKSTTETLYTTGTSTGASLWSSLSSTAANLASSIAEPDEDDALSELQRKMHAEREHHQTNSRYSGFGSEDVIRGRAGMGASKINDGNKEDMIDFGSGNWGNDANTGNAKAPSSTHSLPQQQQQPSNLQGQSSYSSTGQLPTNNKANNKVEGTGDDFFSSFGA